MRKALLSLVIVTVVSIAGAVTYAPYLPQLIMEGIPALVWNGKGTFVSIAGTEAPLNIAQAAPVASAIDPSLQELFDQSGGKAILVARAGQLEIEHYAEGVFEETRFNSFSMAKSLVGALMYKALADGRIESLDVPLGSILPDDKGLANVTLRSLITMRAGIHFEPTRSKAGSDFLGKDADTSPNPFGPLAKLHFVGLDTIERGLVVEADRPSDFLYQNVNTALLGEVLERVYDQPLEHIMAEVIWQPAMALPALWRKPGFEKPVSAYCCIYATARDWVRIGLYLNSNGSPERPFLPVPLWREFMGLDIDLQQRAVDHYGNHIYQNVLDRPGEDLQGPFTYLMGQGGQVLYLMPDRDLVVYRAGDRVQLLHSTLYGAWNSLEHAIENGADRTAIVGRVPGKFDLDHPALPRSTFSISAISSDRPLSSCPRPSAVVSICAPSPAR